MSRSGKVFSQRVPWTDLAVYSRAQAYGPLGETSRQQEEVFSGEHNSYVVWKALVSLWIK
jgi:hypothetical protein